MIKQNHIDFCQLDSATDCDVKALLSWLTQLRAGLIFL